MALQLQTYFILSKWLVAWTLLTSVVLPPMASAQSRSKLSYNHGKKVRLSLGIATMDESDDRFRTGVLAEGSYKRWIARVQHSARSGDAYKDRTVLSTIGYQFGFGRIPFTKLILEGVVGLGVSYESQEILVAAAAEKDINWNAATSLGLQFVAPFRKFYASAGWESRLYPVGPATFFMVFARRQSFYVQTGVWL